MFLLFLATEGVAWHLKDYGWVNTVSCICLAAEAWVKSTWQKMHALTSKWRSKSTEAKSPTIPTPIVLKMALVEGPAGPPGDRPERGYVAGEPAATAAPRAVPMIALLMGVLAIMAAVPC